MADFQYPSALPSPQDWSEVSAAVASSGEAGAVDRFLDQFGDGVVNQSFGQAQKVTLLMVAARNENEKAVRRLLERGADATACLDGWSVLAWAAAGANSPVIIDLLLKHGAEAKDTLQQNETGKNVLIVAIDKVSTTLQWEKWAANRREVALLLVKAGADPHAVPGIGARKSAIDIAMSKDPDLAGMMKEAHLQYIADLAHNGVDEERTVEPMPKLKKMSLSDALREKAEKKAEPAAETPADEAAEAPEGREKLRGPLGTERLDPVTSPEREIVRKAKEQDRGNRSPDIEEDARAFGEKVRIEMDTIGPRGPAPRQMVKPQAPKFHP